MLGGFKTTPINLLTMETGISRVKDRWEFPAATYYIKLSRRQANPAYESVRNILALQYRWKPYSTPAVVAIAPIIKNIGDNIYAPAPIAKQPEYSPHSPWHRAHITFRFFPMSKKKARVNPLEAKVKF